MSFPSESEPAQSQIPSASKPLSRELARGAAVDAGFAEAGLLALPTTNAARDEARFTAWIANGRAGEMQYLKRADDEGRLLRARLSVPFPWARSAVMCFANYHSDQPRSTESADPAAGWIARYAWSGRREADGQQAGRELRPSDYHKVLKKRLAALQGKLHAACGPFEARGFVDTGPVVERALATAAGLGWTGKNTCLIHPKLGSYGFLAVLLTSLDPEEALTPLTVPDRCGACRRCLDACPTGALTAPYQMDASLCIAYLTIEHRGPIDMALLPHMGRQVFGCDICQDVCPWNRKAPISTDDQLQARAELVNPQLDWLAELDQSRFEQLFNGSPVRRAGFNGLRRNVAAAMGSSGLSRYTPRLTEWAAAADEGLRAAAQWALARIESRTEL